MGAGYAREPTCGAGLTDATPAPPAAARRRRCRPAARCRWRPGRSLALGLLVCFLGEPAARASNAADLPCVQAHGATTGGLLVRNGLGTTRLRGVPVGRGTLALRSDLVILGGLVERTRFFAVNIPLVTLTRADCRDEADNRDYRDDDDDDDQGCAHPFASSVDRAGTCDGASAPGRPAKPCKQRLPATVDRCPGRNARPRQRDSSLANRRDQRRQMQFRRRRSARSRRSA